MHCAGPRGRGSRESRAGSARLTSPLPRGHPQWSCCIASSGHGRPRLAASCLALVCATGCVSKNSYDHVAFDLEQRSQELDRANQTISQTQAHLRQGLDDLHASQKQTVQVRTELAEARSEAGGLRQQRDQLTADLAMARNRWAEFEKRAAQTENQLGEAETALIAAKDAADKDQADLQTARDNLAEAAKAGGEARRMLAESQQQQTAMSARLDAATGRRTT